MLSFHKGTETLRLEDVRGAGVSLERTLFEPDEVAAALREAGLRVDEPTVRRPYEVGYPTERVYVVASK